LVFAWTPNLHAQSFFVARGYLKKILRKKLFIMKNLSNFRALTVVM
jgi:hypothetical protein